MKILGRDKLEKFWKRHTDSKGALQAWFEDAQSHSWTTSQNIKDRYRSASFLSGNRVIFNIKGNRYRLVVKVRYQNGIVLIEWVGTHAEYDKLIF